MINFSGKVLNFTPRFGRKQNHCRNLTLGFGRKKTPQKLSLGFGTRQNVALTLIVHCRNEASKSIQKYQF
jgi:hypothetical protein